MPSYFYQSRIPSVNDIVIAEVKTISDVAVYCSLPAYGDMEAMLPTSEINVKRHRRVTDYVRVGQLMPMQVIRDEGTHVDLSLKQVRDDEAAEALERHHKDAKINLIVRSACEQDADLVTAVYRDVIWPLEEEYDGDVWAGIEDIRAGETPHTSIPEGLRTEIMERVAAPVHQASAEVTLRFGKWHDGAARLTACLRDLASRENVEIYVVAPPKYKIVVTAPTKARAAARLTDIQAELPSAC